MAFSPALCPACNHGLPVDLINRPAPEPCPACNRKVQIGVFPALFQKRETPVQEVKKAEGDASCFYHPDKMAVAVCDFCGVLISDLCDLNINGKHICPPCFSKPQNKEKLLQSDRTRTLYDGIALTLALSSFLAPFASPIAIFISLRYWKSPGSIIPRSKIRYILALIVALMPLLGFILLLGFIISGAGK